MRRIESPLDEPEVQITRWRFVFVKHSDATIQRHLVGLVNDEGRVTTGVSALDLKNMRATTASGRVYQVIGDSGKDRDAAYIYEKWLKYGGRAEVKDLTRALKRLRRMRYQPVPSEEALDVAARIMVAKALRGLDPTDAGIGKEKG